MSTGEEQPSTPSSQAHTPEVAARMERDATLRSAFNAFKKRYKVTKLDQESKLSGHRAMTGGKSFGQTGITPPREFAADVWAELAKQGRIKDYGGGFYGLP